MSRTRKRKKITPNKKQLEAERQNHFLRHIKQILVDSGCDKVYSVLSKHMKTALYQLKDSSVKIRISDGSCFTKFEKKKLCEFVDREVRERIVTIENSGYTMSIKEFYTYGLSLHCLQNWFKENKEGKMEEVSKIMEEKLNVVEAEKKLCKELVALCSCIAMIASELNKFLVKVEAKLAEHESGGTLKGLEFIISTYPCEKKQFKLNGNTRPAYRVGSFAYPMIYSEWVTVKRSLFEEPTPFNYIDIPVYIQMHGINRLTERLDTLSKDILELYVFVSLQKPRIRFFRGKVLVDYIYNQTKLGYLLVEIVDNVLLIKTFLLLTNNATPEGEKLKELTGLSKIDMKYWNIDKLSTFQNTDIVKNEELKSIFNKAGCENLFSKAVNFLEEQEHHCVAENMLKYLHEAAC